MKYLLTILVIFLLMPHSSARPVYREGVPPEMMDYCKICHVQSSGLGPLNEYGNDFIDNGKSNKAIAMLDSDGDGYLNLDELNNGTFPGDPDSYPGAKTPGFGFFAGVLSLLFLFIFRKNCWYDMKPKNDLLLIILSKPICFREEGHGSNG